MRIADMRKKAADALFHYFERTVGTVRPPDIILDGDDKVHLPYLRRWWVIPRNRWFNIYLHHFQRSDNEDDHHDHPWANLSIILHGEYIEHWIAQGGVRHVRIRKAGDIVFRWPWFAHRIAMAPGGQCVSLFITGPDVRKWGFHTRKGWVHWKTYLGVAN